MEEGRKGGRVGGMGGRCEEVKRKMRWEVVKKEGRRLWPWIREH